jgi:hypothetical protein
VPAQSRQEAGLAVPRPAHSPPVASDDDRPRDLAAFVDRVPASVTRVLGVEGAAVRPLEHGHATLLPPEWNRSLLRVVEEAEHDATFVDAVGLRGDVAGQQAEVDGARGLAALPENRVGGPGAAVAVCEADDVASVVDRLDLHLE